MKKKTKNIYSTCLIFFAFKTLSADMMIISRKVVNRSFQVAGDANCIASKCSECRLSKMHLYLYASPLACIVHTHKYLSSNRNAALFINHGHTISIARECHPTKQ